MLTVLLALLPAVRAAGTAPPGPAVELGYRRGDDARWAAPDWDDRDWRRAPQDSLFIPVHDGIYWVRFHLRQSTEGAGRDVNRTFFWPRDEAESPINAIFMATPFSFELYWDGRLIRRSGVVGAGRSAEIPGPLDNLFPVPGELLGPGEHVVALRISTAHHNFQTNRSGFYFAMVNFADRLVYETRQPILPLCGAGAAALGAIFCTILFRLGDRRRPLLLCSALSLMIGFFYLLVAWRWLHNDTYDWFAPRLTAIAVTVTVLSGLQAWLLLEQFAMPRPPLWLAALVPLIIAAWLSSPFHAVIVLWIYRATLGFSVVAAGWAAARRRIGARWVLVAALLGLGSLQLVWDARSFVSPAFLLTFGAQLLCLCIALSLQLNEDRRRGRDMALTAARLEVELLKKNLQPHFLLNTLAVLTEIVEQDPGRAVKLIDGLADEFRSVARVSAKKLIPLAHEIELCRAHLRVMSVRLGRSLDLDAAGVDEAAPVPPAALLTLLENSFAHQGATGGGTTFTLRSGRAADGTTRHVFFSPGEVRAAPERPAGGTGLRYVKARLEESFPGKWTLVDGPAAGGWQTVIEIKNRRGGGFP